MSKHSPGEVDVREQSAEEGDRYGFNSKAKEITNGITESNSCKAKEKW